MAGNFRKAGKEQYYTLPDVGEHFAKVMVDRYGVDHLWLEPSGGKGDLIEGLICNGVDASSITSYFPVCEAKTPAFMPGMKRA